MSATYSGKLFLLGATGYIGSQFLIHLKDQYPNIHVIALVRNATEERKVALAQSNPNITVVEGSIDDDTIVREQASKVDIIVNAGNAQHESSIRDHCTGWSGRSFQTTPRKSSHLYSRIWMCATKYIDATFSPNDVPKDNIMIEISNEIIAVGERKENPIKTMIILPSWVYGIGDGVQKITLGLRMYLNFSKAAGYAITFGRGLNQSSSIHIKDVANSMITMIKGALDGTAGTGAQGLYFAGDEFETSPSLKEVQDEIGNVLYELGLVSQPGSQSIPLSSPLAQSLPGPVLRIFSGNSYGVAEKLKKLGIEFTETKSLTLLQSLRDEVKLAVKEGAWA
ncbi:hypothetical protein AX16_000257 [Volvariella volvacea WC 439]|nr:hypothetical protein AX16_000257 [Volvariella volvacea WC 439]